MPLLLILFALKTFMVVTLLSMVLASLQPNGNLQPSHQTQRFLQLALSRATLTNQIVFINRHKKFKKEKS
jgi:hypothetical protein